MHLSVLAVARFVLLRRKGLPDGNVSAGEEKSKWRDMVCTAATLETWRRDVGKLQRTLAANDPSHAPHLCDPSAQSPPLELAVSVASSDRSVAALAVAVEPTPAAASYHLALFSESLQYIGDLLDQQSAL